jgi:CheY-like chemotaxis protein
MHRHAGAYASRCYPQICHYADTPPLPAAGGGQIRALRSSPRTRQIGAIALTGFGRRNDARMALDAGFDAHIGKPASLDALSQTIRQVLAEKHQRTDQRTDV